MPELPEVETVLSGLRAALEGKIIENIELKRDHLRTPIPRDLPQKLKGRKIDHFIRRGKYMALLPGVNLQGEPPESALIWHLGMSGRVRIYAEPNEYAPQKHDHIIIRAYNKKDRILIIYEDPRRFGMFYSLPFANWETHEPFVSMGSEPLSNHWTCEHFSAQLQNRSAPIKNALLDQRVVAGFGNIYVCEALHGAHISPLRPANTLSAKESEKLLREGQAVLKRAIEAGGSTLRDYRQADGSLGYFQHNFSVYDREGEACVTCAKNGKKSVIIRIVQSGRSSFYCPLCQI